MEPCDWALLPRYPHKYLSVAPTCLRPPTHTSQTPRLRYSGSIMRCSALHFLATLVGASHGFTVDTSILDAELLSGLSGLSTLSQGSRFAVATLVATDSYVDGGIALAASLRASREDSPVPDIALVAVVVATNGDADSKGVSAGRVPWLRAAGWDVRLVDARDAVQCAPGSSDRRGLGGGRFVHGCAKLHLWEQLVDFDRVLYVDADSFARPGSFSAAELLKRFAGHFAAKPVPPDSRDCGGRHARVQLGEETAGSHYDVVFAEVSLGIALVSGEATGDLVVSAVKPGLEASVEVGSTLISVGSEAVPAGLSPSTLATALQQAPRPITLTFRRKHPSTAPPAAADSLDDLLSRPGSDPTAAEASEAVAHMHSCHDLFNTNIMVLRPSQRTFRLMTAALDHLKGAATTDDATAFDSGFLSRFFGSHWEHDTDGSRWLPFAEHMELTLAAVHWPYHPSVAAHKHQLAHSPAMANMLAWGQIRTVDFAGPVKPWALLEAATGNLANGRAADVVEAAWLAADAAIPGGDGATRRPVVDLTVTLFGQWLSFYLEGCAWVERAAPELAGLLPPSTAPPLPLLCALHPAVKVIQRGM